MTKEEALSEVKSLLTDLFPIEEYDKVEEIMKALEQPPKTGYWTEHSHEWGDNWQYSRYECSCCHDWAYFDSDFCPNCGAKMLESEDKNA